MILLQRRGNNCLGLAQRPWPSGLGLIGPQGGQPPFMFKHLGLVRCASWSCWEGLCHEHLAIKPVSVANKIRFFEQVLVVELVRWREMIAGWSLQPFVVVVWDLVVFSVRSPELCKAEMLQHPFAQKPAVTLPVFFTPLKKMDLSGK